MNITSTAFLIVGILGNNSKLCINLQVFTEEMKKKFSKDTGSGRHFSILGI